MSDSLDQKKGGYHSTNKDGSTDQINDCITAVSTEQDKVPSHASPSSHRSSALSNSFSALNRKDKKMTDVSFFFATDIITYTFLLVWILLCGIMLFRKIAMWRFAVTAAAFEILSLVSPKISLFFLPKLKSLEPSKIDLWHNTLMSYIHSLSASLGVSLVLLLERSTFLKDEGMYRGHGQLAYTVVSISCGYFAFDLWDVLRRKLYNPRSPSILAHNALLLVCFTTALYRDVTIDYLIITLVCEVNSIFLHQRRLIGLLGITWNSKLNKLNWVFIWATFFGARVTSHALIPFLLILDYKTFPLGMEFPMAMCGMLCFNFLNFELFRDLLRAQRKEMGVVGSERKCD